MDSRGVGGGGGGGGGLAAAAYTNPGLSDSSVSIQPNEEFQGSNDFICTHYYFVKFEYIQ